MVEKEQIIDALQQVIDPELNLDVWMLGLIYDIAIDNKKVVVQMTLTSPVCPYGPAMMDDVRRHVSSVEGVGDVEVNLTFDPPWGPEKMTEEARIALGV